MSSPVSKTESQVPSARRPRRSLGRAYLRMLENFLVETNWKHVGFKLCAYTYLAFILWITWHVAPFSKNWIVPRQNDGIPIVHQDFTNYFGLFEGGARCGIQADDLYIPPQNLRYAGSAGNEYCHNRAQLLQAMSHGGRYGFDAPYKAKGCHYRWYSVPEICAIMDRFDGLIFIGDSTLQTIYSGLNILLRQDLAHGSLKTWEMSDEEMTRCDCDNQFVKDSCTKHVAISSEEVIHNVGGKHKNSYTCQRTPHAFLAVDKSPSPPNIVQEFKSLARKAPPSHYRPIPIIHSLTLPNDQSLATASLSEFLALADFSERKTPMLWIGPPAAGHVEIKGRKGNQDIWRFATAMAETAAAKDVEVLGMWNLTVQAGSWDGQRFGERVAITQAMMVVNWLARLESS